MMGNLDFHLSSSIRVSETEGSAGSSHLADSVHIAELVELDLILRKVVILKNSGEEALMANFIPTEQQLKAPGCMYQDTG